MPGPEHAMLKKLEGEWAAKLLGPNGEEIATGATTYKMQLGGLWLASHFKAEMFGQLFEGRGYDGYDEKSGKFQSVWVDSMTAKPTLFEGTYDKAKKTMTMKGKAADGRTLKSVTHFKNDDFFSFAMYIIGDGGAEEKMLATEYTRKK